MLFLGHQTPRPVHPKPTAILAAPQETAPVTAREARDAFARLIALYGDVNGVRLGAPSIPALDRPATRGEVVAEMARLYRTAEPGIRFTPAEIRFDVSRLSIDRPSLPILRRLVARGFVGPVAPLATGPKPTLGIKQFGDALGFFGSRLAQISHLPSPAWTPMLKPD